MATKLILECAVLKQSMSAMYAKVGSTVYYTGKNWEPDRALAKEYDNIGELLADIVDQGRKVGGMPRIGLDAYRLVELREVAKSTEGSV